jgi:transcriptional regulator with XRE-family HTH domain
MTLQQVAARAGLTRSYLSKIESDQATPSIAALTRIAQAVGGSVSGLLEDSRRDEALATRSSDVQAQMIRSDHGYQFHAFMSSLPDKRMQPYLFTARRGEVRHREALTHAGQEFVYVLEGQLEFRVGGRVFALAPGDALYFNAEHDHDVEPITEQARWLAVFVAPPVKRVYRRKAASAAHARRRKLQPRKQNKAS